MCVCVCGCTCLYCGDKAIHRELFYDEVVKPRETEVKLMLRTSLLKQIYYTLQRNITSKHHDRLTIITSQLKCRISIHNVDQSIGIAGPTCNMVLYIHSPG